MKQFWNPPPLSTNPPVSEQFFLDPPLCPNFKNEIPHPPPPSHLRGGRKLCSIIDVQLSSKYASDKLFSFYSKVNVFFQIAIFQSFAQRNPYTETLYINIAYLYVTEFT